MYKLVVYIGVCILTCNSTEDSINQLVRCCEWEIYVEAMSSQVIANKTKRPAPPPPRNSTQLNAPVSTKPSPPKRPSPQSSPSKPLPPPTAINGAVQHQQVQTQPPATAATSQRPISPSRSNGVNNAQRSLSPPRAPPQPPSSGRGQPPKAKSPPREAPQPPSRVAPARNGTGSHVQQPPAPLRPPPPQAQASLAPAAHRALSSSNSVGSVGSVGSAASNDQLLMKYKTVERNYEQLKNVARKGERRGLLDH